MLFALLTIYIGQAGQYRNLSKNAPNLWSFLASVQNSGLSLFAVMLAGAAAAFLLYLLWDKCRRVTPDALLSAALALLYSALNVIAVEALANRHVKNCDILVFYRAPLMPVSYTHLDVYKRQDHVKPIDLTLKELGDKGRIPNLKMVSDSFRDMMGRPEKADKDIEDE